MYLVKSPQLLQLFYPSLTWHMPRSEKVVYLTFDDGPIPDVTDFVLKTLNTFGAKATFFCIGDNILKHPQVFKRLMNEGHSIGNHTFNHLKGWDTGNAEYVENVLKCQALTKTNLFRPPYGRIKTAQIRLLKKKFPAENTQDTPMNIVMWDVLSGDFDPSITPQRCYQNVVKHAENGSIIVFHDSEKAFERLSYALPKALKYFKENGYQFGML